MKNLLNLLLLVLFISNLNAQNNFALLKESKINVEFDYSSAKIESINAKDYFDDRKYFNTDFELEYKNEVFKEFIGSLYENIPSSYKIRFVFEDADYKMIVKIIDVTSKGDTKAEISIFNIKTSETIAKSSFFGRGGVYGSFTNLSGDGIKRIGRKIANKIINSMPYIPINKYLQILFNII